ncbi:importin subunit alpha (macronuclear) [Tetrahymena thermophila SB210]|uniref:Importin subunit alpha n=1 Tax=Tetrahymena thermophila (strain SB210) TaxID=312017 RepID=Q232L8_TETTS|nr:importin subunit alpha [Tetrahymena thermophila SB210]EAR91394.1 importin subunit alpha [Tetrahymena thermophila SB210]|eukprot:XP_001011639.1 importin subunit alpha [Tetrahymena thermophila SB210]
MDTQILGQVNLCKEKLTQEGSPLETIIELRKMTSKEVSPPLQEIIQSNVCTQLIAIMDNTTSNEIILESLWILTNVCSGSSSQTQYVINIGGIATFLKYVQHESEDIMAQALWGLGNIAGDSSSSRDQVLKQDAVTIVLKQLERKDIKIVNQRTIVWVISNFCRGKPQPKYEIVRPCVFYLGKALEKYKNDPEIVADSLWGINYLSETELAIDDLINYGILQNICQHFLNFNSTSTLTPAVRIIGNVATSRDNYVDILLQQNILQPLIQLFVHDKKAYRKESLWTVSNIMAGTSTQVQKVLEQPNFYQNLINNVGQQLDIRKEMLYVMSNGLGHSAACSFFLKNGILQVFFEQFEEGDSKMKMVILEGLQLLLKYVNKNKKVYPVLNGKLQYLKSIATETIYSNMADKLKAVYKLLRNYEKINPPVDAINSQLENLKIDEQQQRQTESSYETIDNEEDDEEDMDEEFEDCEDIDEEEEQQNDEIQNNLNKQKAQGANAKGNQEYESIQSNDKDFLGAAAGPAAPPNLDQLEYQYTDEQQQYMQAQAGAAPGP